MAKIGLFLCECGPNIAEAIDLDCICESIQKDDTVARVERHKLLCSEDGKKFFANSLKTNEFDRIVIAACSPKQHEATFMEVMSDNGINPYLMQLVNIREQVAWVTPDKKTATNKALTSIRAAISRISYHQHLENKEIECNPAVIIIGGSIAGLEAAQRTACTNRQVFLLEENDLGGTVRQHRLLLPSMQPSQELLKEKMKAIQKNTSIEVYEHCFIEDILGFFGNFVAHIRTSDNKPVMLNAGAIILAPDCQSYRPSNTNKLGYGTLDNVLTAAEFEQRDEDTITTKSGTPPSSIAIIHCVGRKELGYCSKMCCANSMKLSREIKQHNRDISVAQFYKNLCLPNTYYEKFYHDTKKQGVEFIRYQDLSITKDNKHLIVNATSSGTAQKKYPVDMVILSTGLMPAPSVKRFAELFNIPVDEHGFLKEEHNILEPVSTVTEGVYITNGMYGPGSIHDSIAQAGAAAGKIITSLVPGKQLVLEAKTSRVSETVCMGCGICVDVCAYGAVKLDEHNHISVVNEVLCRGCGNCAAACPSGAAQHRHFTTRQIFREMNQILR